MAIVLFVLLTVTAITRPAMAQTSEGCFTLAQTTTGPESVTLWCQILDYSIDSPLTSTWDTGPVPLQRGFTASTMHMQYDPWYSAMDSVFTVEIGTFTQAIILSAVMVTGDIGSYIQDIPLGGFTVAPGSTIRITERSTISHTCNPLDNCGLHMAITFQ